MRSPREAIRLKEICNSPKAPQLRIPYHAVISSGAAGIRKLQALSEYNTAAQSPSSGRGVSRSAQ